MITQPGFLDDPDFGKTEHISSDYANMEEAKNPALKSPTLLSHDPNGPDKLSMPDEIEQIPEKTDRVTGFGIVPVAAGLIFSWFAICSLTFVIREYQVAHLLGFAAGALVTITFLFIGSVLTRELLSWRTLGEIARLRAILASPLSSRQDVLTAATEWLSLIPKTVPLPEDAHKLIRSYDTADEIRGYLRTKVSPVLDNVVLKYTNASTLQIAAMTAVSPKILWDDIGTVLRSFVLIRQIAMAYGIRQGLSTTLALFKHIVITAAMVPAAASLVNKFAIGIISKAHPLGEHFLEASGVGGMEVTRIRHLAAMTARSCNPMER